MRGAPLIELLEYCEMKGIIDRDEKGKRRNKNRAYALVHGVRDKAGNRVGMILPHVRIGDRFFVPVAAADRALGLDPASQEAA